MCPCAPLDVSLSVCDPVHRGHADTLRAGPEWPRATAYSRSRKPLISRRSVRPGPLRPAQPVIRLLDQSEGAPMGPGGERISLGTSQPRRMRAGASTHATPVARVEPSASVKTNTVTVGPAWVGAGVGGVASPVTSIGAGWCHRHTSPPRPRRGDPGREYQGHPWPASGIRHRTCQGCGVHIDRRRAGSQASEVKPSIRMRSRSGRRRSRHRPKR